MKYTYSYTPAAGPKSSPYVFSCIFVGSEELQWYASKYANCNGVSIKFKNCNGMNQNNPKETNQPKKEQRALPPPSLPRILSPLPRERRSRPRRGEAAARHLTNGGPLPPPPRKWAPRPVPSRLVCSGPAPLLGAGNCCSCGVAQLLPYPVCPWLRLLQVLL